MMQLLCDGVMLDLYDNAEVQFTHDNPLFAFDDLKCERTSSFKLPTTPTNDKVFNLARIPAYDGEGMRRKFTAQLQMGAAVRDGYLYVGSFDGKDYNCIFVTGELVGLQQIKDAGKMSDILHFNNALTWNDSNPTSADAASLPYIGHVKYKKQTDHINPSISLRWLIEQGAAAVGATIVFPVTAEQDRQRIFSTKEKYSLSPYDANISFDSNQLLSTLIDPTLGVASYENHDCVKLYAVSEPDGQGGYEWDAQTAQEASRKTFKEIVFPYDIVLEFGENVDERLCLISGDIGYDRYDLNKNAEFAFTFLDERQFRYNANGTIYYIGEPLSSRKVSIPANMPFTLVRGTGFTNRVPGVDDEETIGFDIDDNNSYNLDVKVTIDHEFVYGDNIPYNALLPDLTLVELLKMYAYTNGLMLNYRDGQVGFDALNLATFPIKEISQVIAEKEIERTFGNYGQRNNVQFKSDNNVRQSERIVTTYKIHNDNIDKDHELATIAVSEGGLEVYRGSNGTINRILIRTNGNDTIGDALTTDEYMQRVTLPLNAGLQHLCDKSTMFKVNIRMSAYEYCKIIEKTIIQIDGIKYLWTDRKWGNNSAEFKLAKI